MPLSLASLDTVSYAPTPFGPGSCCSHCHARPYCQFLDKITYWTVNNGMLTSVVGLVVILTFSTMPTNMVYLSVHLLLSKCAFLLPHAYMSYNV